MLFGFKAELLVICKYVCIRICMSVFGYLVLCLCVQIQILIADPFLFVKLLDPLDTAANKTALYARLFISNVS